VAKTDRSELISRKPYEMLFDLQRRAQSRGQEVYRRRFEDIVDADAIGRARRPLLGTAAPSCGQPAAAAAGQLSHEQFCSDLRSLVCYAPTMAIVMEAA